MAYSDNKYDSGGDWDKQSSSYDSSWDDDAWGTYLDPKTGMRYRDQKFWHNKRTSNNQHRRTNRNETYELGYDPEYTKAGVGGNPGALGDMRSWLEKNRDKKGSDIQQHIEKDKWGWGDAWKALSGGSFNFVNDYNEARKSGDASRSFTFMPDGSRTSGNDGLRSGTSGSVTLAAENESSVKRLDRDRASWMKKSGVLGSQRRAQLETEYNLKEAYGRVKRRRGDGWGG